MGHLYWKLCVHEPSDIKHGRFFRTVFFAVIESCVTHMTTVRVGSSLIAHRTSDTEKKIYFKSLIPRNGK